jgi:hypothetical protein
VGQLRKTPFYSDKEKSFVPVTALCIHFEDIYIIMNENFKTKK